MQRKEHAVLKKTWRFITLLLVALLMGMTFCHVLELPAKLQYPATLYLTLHRTLYVAFGPPNIGAFIEVGTILAATVLVFLVYQHRPAFWLTLLGAVSLIAGLVVFFAYVEPANVALKSMTLNAPPPEWTRWRNQWEYGHAAHFVLHALGFSALLLSVVLETFAVPPAAQRVLPEHNLPQASRQPGR
jgi:hypothetical protein